MNMNNKEIEIKLRLTDAAKIPQLKKYLVKAAVNIAMPELAKTKMRAIYYDTRDGFFRAHRIAYRIRQENNSIMATYKSIISEKDGITTRIEINKKVKSLRPDISIFASESSVWPLLQSVSGSEFIPVVETDFLRESILVDWHGSHIEAAIDIGHVSGKDNTLPICELELELKSGDEAMLLTLKKTLESLFPIETSLVSKYHQGLILAGLA